MELNSGQLSEADKQKIAQWLTAKGVRGECPNCGRTTGVIADHLLNFHPYTPQAALTIGGATYPAAVLFCSNCGHLRLFSAVMIGVLPVTSNTEAGNAK